MMIEKLLSEKEWLIEEESYVPEKNPFYETLFTLANGYVGVRGSLEQGSQTSRPGTYFAGVFDATPFFFTELANAPSWVGLKVIADGETVDLEKGEILDYRRFLDMKKGLLIQLLRWKSPMGKITRFESWRLVHLSHKHVALIKGIIVPENYSGTVSLKSSLDGYTFNTSSPKQLKIKHFKLTEYGDRKEDGIYLEMKTYTSGISICMASKLKLNVPSQRDVEYDVDKVAEVLTFQVEEGKIYEFEKFVTFYTSREIKDGKEAAWGELKLRIKEGSEALLREHVSYWEEKWGTADVRIYGDEIAQKSLRFNIFHLIQSVNPDDERVSVAARALHGEGYRGHVFWDTEIFMLPFYIYTNPEAARSLLMYRYHNLDAARKNACINSYRGAQFPWESAGTGEEVTPKEVLVDLSTGDKVRIWTGEKEHHIVADIAFGVDHYFTATGDDDFLTKYGAEILLETARFWASRVEFDPKKQAYVINNVMGPDEFHEHVNNSVYTNFMAKWNLYKALEYIEMLKKLQPEVWKQLKEKIALGDDEPAEWKKIADNIYIPYNEKSGLYEEFEGYFKLEDAVIAEFDENDMPVIPKELRKRVNETTIIKQADVILLQYLLGDQFDPKVKKLNFDYCNIRTAHASSLSSSIYAILSAEVRNLDEAYKYFLIAARVDLDDNRGNADVGIHAGSMGGTWQAAIAGFAGMRIHKGKLAFNPRLPKKWSKMEFRVKRRGDILNVVVSKDAIELALQTRDYSKAVVDVIVGREPVSIVSGKVYRIPYTLELGN